MTLLWYAKTIYPDKFKDIDLNKEVEKYYKEVFGVELTEEQEKKDRKFHYKWILKLNTKFQENH